MAINRNPEAIKTDPNLARQLRIPNTIKCPVCKCEWFEQLRVAQYSQEHFVILGQPVPEASPIFFHVLKCAKCGELVEPNIQSGPRDIAYRYYDEFLEQIEEKPMQQVNDGVIM